MIHYHASPNKGKHGSVSSTSNQASPESFISQETISRILEKKVEILALATLVAAISFITGLGGLAFAACIIQVGAFPYIHSLFIETALEPPIPFDPFFTSD